MPSPFDELPNFDRVERPLSEYPDDAHSQYSMKKLPKLPPRPTQHQNSSFVQKSSSRPAQSVTSTNLDDSETLVRLYKRKKQECEGLKEHALSLETELQQLKQIIESQNEELQRQEASQAGAD